MPTQEIKFIDGETKEIDIPKLLPYTIGRKIRRAIKVSIDTDKSGSSKAHVEDGMQVFDEAISLIYEGVIKHHLTEDEQEKISMESVDTVLEFYWPQVEGGLKKKDRNNTASTSS